MVLDRDPTCAASPHRTTLRREREIVLNRDPDPAKRAALQAAAVGGEGDGARPRPDPRPYFHPGKGQRALPDARLCGHTVTCFPFCTCSTSIWCLFWFV